MIKIIFVSYYIIQISYFSFHIFQFFLFFLLTLCRFSYLLLLLSFQISQIFLSLLPEYTEFLICSQINSVFLHISCPVLREKCGSRTHMTSRQWAPPRLWSPHAALPLPGILSPDWDFLAQLGINLGNWTFWGFSGEFSYLVNMHSSVKTNAWRRDGSPLLSK